MTLWSYNPYLVTGNLKRLKGLSTNPVRLLIRINRSIIKILTDLSNQNKEIKAVETCTESGKIRIYVGSVIT